MFWTVWTLPSFGYFWHERSHTHFAEKYHEGFSFCDAPWRHSSYRNHSCASKLSNTIRETLIPRVYYWIFPVFCELVKLPRWFALFYSGICEKFSPSVPIVLTNLPLNNWIERRSLLTDLYRARAVRSGYHTKAGWVLVGCSDESPLDLRMLRLFFFHYCEWVSASPL